MSKNSVRTFKFNYDISNTNETRGLGFDSSASREIRNNTSTVFGEINPETIDNLIYRDNLIDWDTVKIIVDWGMGAGKILLQLYERCPQLELLVGAEIVPSRYNVAVCNVTNLHKYLDDDDAVLSTINTQLKSFNFENKFDALDEDDNEHTFKNSITLMTSDNKRLIFSNNSMFDHIFHMRVADVIFLDVAIPDHMMPKLFDFVKEAAYGAIIISYQQLGQLCHDKILQSIEHDKMHTSWAPKRGHKFHIYKRI